MTEEKWDALRIADWFEGGLGGCEMEAAAELRRLHAVNQELLEALQAIIGHDAHLLNQWRVETARAAIAKATGEQT